MVKMIHKVNIIFKSMLVEVSLEILIFKICHIRRHYIIHISPTFNNLMIWPHDKLYPSGISMHYFRVTSVCHEIFLIPAFGHSHRHHIRWPI